MGVAARFEPAACTHVHVGPPRRALVGFEGALVPGSPRGEACGFRQQRFADGERVLYLRDVNLLGRDAGSLVGARRGRFTPFDDCEVPIGDADVVGRSADSRDGNPTVAIDEFCCSFLVRDKNDSRPVAEGSAIEQFQWRCDVVGLQHCFEVDLALKLGSGVLIPRFGDSLLRSAPDLPRWHRFRGGTVVRAARIGWGQ
jgi:hypothetical protein